MIRITGKTALRAMERALEERGYYYVYQNVSSGGDLADGCVNWHLCEQVGIDEPGCLVGWALHHLGINMRQDGYRLGSAEEVIKKAEHDGFAVVTQAAKEAFAVAQAAQDNKVPWGRAVEIARRLLAIKRDEVKGDIL